MNRYVDKLLQSLLLIRIGQELGTESAAARLIHEWISLVLSAIKIFS